MEHPVKVYRRYVRSKQRSGIQMADRQKTLMAEHQCLNCGMTYVGNFCPCCGQTSKTERFTLKQTVNHLLFFFTKFDDKFKNTVINLGYRPGYMIREYIAGHRVNYMRPVQMLVCLVTVYALITYFFFPADEPVHLLKNIEEGNFPVAAKLLESSPFLKECVKLIENAMNSTIISTLAFIFCLTFASRVTFRKTGVGRNYNLAEHFFVLTYVACMNKLADFILLPYNAWNHDSSSNTLTYFLILWWVTCQMYELKKRTALFKVLWMFILTGLEILLIATIIILLLAPFGIYNFDII